MREVSTFPSTPTTQHLPQLAHDLQHCQALTRHHSKTFYLGSRLLPAHERAAVWALYAACRLGDDIADSALPLPERKERLALWHERTQSALAGATGKQASGQVAEQASVYRALSWAAGHYPVPAGAFAELHEGFLMDMALDSGEFAFESMQDLTLYCRRVAGVVGFMVAPVVGYRGGPKTLEQALLLGQAMQLTNVLRDVGEDLGRGRCYLPAALLREYGAQQALQAKRADPPYRSMMLTLSAQAHNWYEAGRAGIPKLRGPSRLGVAMAGRAYEGILHDLRGAHFDNFGRRAHVSTLGKLRLLPKALQDTRAAQHPQAAAP